MKLATTLALLSPIPVFAALYASTSCSSSDSPAQQIEEDAGGQEPFEPEDSGEPIGEKDAQPSFECKWVDDLVHRPIYSSGTQTGVRRAVVSNYLRTFFSQDTTTPPFDLGGDAGSGAWSSSTFASSLIGSGGPDPATVHIDVLTYRPVYLTPATVPPTVIGFRRIIADNTARMFYSQDSTKGDYTFPPMIDAGDTGAWTASAYTATFDGANAPNPATVQVDGYTIRPIFQSGSQVGLRRIVADNTAKMFYSQDSLDSGSGWFFPPPVDSDGGLGPRTWSTVSFADAFGTGQNAPNAATLHLDTYTIRGLYNGSGVFNGLRRVIVDSVSKVVYTQDSTSGDYVFPGGTTAWNAPIDLASYLAGTGIAPPACQ